MYQQIVIFQFWDYIEKCFYMLITSVHQCMLLGYPLILVYVCGTNKLLLIGILFNFNYQNYVRICCSYPTSILEGGSSSLWSARLASAAAYTQTPFIPEPLLVSVQSDVQTLIP